MTFAAEFPHQDDLFHLRALVLGSKSQERFDNKSEGQSDDGNTYNWSKMTEAEKKEDADAIMESVDKEQLTEKASTVLDKVEKEKK